MVSGFNPAYNRVEPLRNACCWLCPQLSSLPPVISESVLFQSFPLLGAIWQQHAARPASTQTLRFASILQGLVRNSYRAQTLRQEKGFLMLPLMIPLVNSGTRQILQGELHFFLAAGMTAGKSGLWKKSSKGDLYTNRDSSVKSYILLYITTSIFLRYHQEATQIPKYLLKYL